MKQHLRSLWTLLLLMMWCSVGFAQTITADFTNGNIPSGWSKTGTTAKNSDYGTQLQKNTSVTSPAFTETISTITINLTRSSNGTIFSIGYIKDGKKTDFKTFRSNDVTQNKLKDYNVVVPTEAQVSGVKFVFTSAKSSYYIKTITFTPGKTKTKTTLTFPETAISINGGDEASFKGQPAKLYAGEQELTDKTIKYAQTGGDDIFATFDGTTGAATLKSGVYGTATVTATYEGNDTYEKSEASYTVKVIDPNASEVTFDFSKPGDFGCDVPTSNNGTDIEEGQSIVSGIVSLTVKKNGKTKSRFWNSKGTITYRIYNGTINTVSVPEGYVITAISVTTNGDDNFILGENTDNSNWTGSAQSVKIEGKGSTSFKTMTVTYSKVATPTSLPLDETTTAEDAKTLLGANLNKTVNVTINRTLVANKWNTLCLPFDVTAEQIKNILKAEGMVREYADDDATAQTITFKKVEGNMKAGEPYLIKPTEDITSLAFEGVTITAVEGNLQGKAYGICGTLGKYAMNTDGTELFLNAAGKFVAPAAATNTMKGFRAYFMVPKGASAAAININIDGETTGINNIETNATVNGKVYNLNGQYVGNSLNGLKKGIYVVNGKKVIK